MLSAHTDDIISGWLNMAWCNSDLRPAFNPRTCGRCARNAVSYVMLANPLQFASFWAYIYSSFAALKFAMFTFAYVAAAVGLLVGVGFLAKCALLRKT